MGTKMASGFASLFMGKLEMDCLGSCDKTHLIWLRFLDGIFMKWNHRQVLLLWIFYVFVLSCVCYVLCASGYMCFVVTCWERADLLALVCGVYCEFVTFQLVSWVRFDTWLYRFLNFAPLLTLHDFISKINNCHDTIKSTFNYSNQEAFFLDVNFKMKENAELDTQTVISTLHLHQVILFHASMAFTIVRPNVTDVLRQITHVLKKILAGWRNIFWHEIIQTCYWWDCQKKILNEQGRCT